MGIRRQRPGPLTFRQSIPFCRLVSSTELTETAVRCFAPKRLDESSRWKLDTGNHGIKPSEEPLSRIISVEGSKELVLYEHFAVVNRIDRSKIDTFCGSDLRLFRNLN